MREQALLRALGLIQREIEAADLRLELGGREPEGDNQLWCSLAGGWRLVATYDFPPENRGALLDRLTALAQSFSELSPAANLTPAPGLTADLSTLRLAEELDALAQRSKALCAVVIDTQSPVIWGSSDPHGHTDIEAAEHLARLVDEARAANFKLEELLAASPEAVQGWLDRGKLSTALEHGVKRVKAASSAHGLRAWQSLTHSARAIVEVRRGSPESAPRVGGPGRSAPPPKRAYYESGPEFGYLARSFANLYLLILVFDAPFSQLQAEGALVHALPLIEKLVLSLPPVEPPPRGARVVKLPSR